MGVLRREDRRSGRRAFRPSVDGRLEPRVVPSAVSPEIERLAQQIAAARSTPRVANRVVKPAAVRAKANGNGAANYQHFTKDGGRAVRILDGKGSAFDVQITGVGTVRARALRDGTVQLIVRGSDSATELAINPVEPVGQQGQAHTFNPAFGQGDGIMRLGGIQVRSGKIGSILGFRTANLSGPIDIRSDAAVSRIALNRLLPGARITTTGDLDTLDVFTDATLSGGNSVINVGRDLNWANIRGNLTLSDGAGIVVGRDLGLIPQGTKGTGVGGQGLLVQGNLAINPGSTLRIDRDVAGPIVVYGNFSGASRFVVGGSIDAPVNVLGTVTA